jgi:hypothetical protein
LTIKKVYCSAIKRCQTFSPCILDIYHSELQTLVGIKVICKVRRLGGENGQFRHNHSELQKLQTLVGIKVICKVRRSGGENGQFRHNRHQMCNIVAKICLAFILFHVLGEEGSHYSNLCNTYENTVFIHG